MRARNVIKAEINRQWHLLRRYPLQTLASGLTFIFISATAWLGLRAAFFANEGYEAVSGVLLWPLIMASLGFAAGSLEQDMVLGTIEQLYSTSPSVLSVIHYRAVSYLFLTVLFSFPLWIMGAYFLGVVPLLLWLFYTGIPLVLTIYGIGLALGGVALIFRRTGQFVSLLALLLMAVMVLQVSWPTGWFGFLLRHSLPMIGASMVPNMQMGDILASYVVGLLYLLAGQSIFRRAEDKAKRLGLIGHY